MDYKKNLKNIIKKIKITNDLIINNIENIEFQKDYEFMQKHSFYDAEIDCYIKDLQDLLFQYRCEVIYYITNKECKEILDL
jgi:hypothetical protein